MTEYQKMLIFKLVYWKYNCRERSVKISKQDIMYAIVWGCRYPLQLPVIKFGVYIDDKQHQTPEEMSRSVWEYIKIRYSL